MSVLPNNLTDHVAWRMAMLHETERVALMAEQAFDPAYQETWSADQMTSLLISSNSWLQVAELESEILAFSLCRQVCDEVELLLCATNILYRHKGLGQNMLAKCEAQCLQRDAKHLFLEVRASNLAAISLYKGYGFIESGRRKNYYTALSGEMVDAITLTKDVG